MGQELYHYGILGMKWGIRRYQNADGSLTSAGKTHYKNMITGKDAKARKGIDAAHIQYKINKLEKKKNLSEKKQAKLQSLKTARAGLVKDLSDRDIEYGQHLFNMRKNLMLTSFFGTPLISAGYLALGKAPREVARMTKENLSNTKTVKNAQKKIRDKF